MPKNRNVSADYSRNAYKSTCNGKVSDVLQAARQEVRLETIEVDSEPVDGGRSVQHIPVA